MTTVTLYRIVLLKIETVSFVGLLLESWCTKPSLMTSQRTKGNEWGRALPVLIVQYMELICKVQSIPDLFYFISSETHSSSFYYPQ